MVLEEESCLWNLVASQDRLSCVMWAGYGTSASSLHLICLLFSNSLDDKPQSRGIRWYCMRNFYNAAFDGGDEFLNNWLNVCTRHLAFPLVAGWNSTPVKCMIPCWWLYSWNSSDMKIVALSMWWLLDGCMGTWSRHLLKLVSLFPWIWLHSQYE